MNFTTLYKSYPDFIEYYTPPTFSSFLQQKGIDSNAIEGHSGQLPRQQDRLKKLVKHARSILEIGFNFGHSSQLFLEYSDATVVSFDLGEHAHLRTGKEYIDQYYPKRHLLIIGNSLQTVPSYAEQHPEKRFDVIFIDGGHDYETAQKDLENCRAFAHSNTIVLMDDVVSRDEMEREYTIGPKQAWRDAERKNKLITFGQEDYEIGRGMIWGKYK